MSYKIYQTEGFVLSGRALKEEDGLFLVLTPDLGLISVIAKSSRSMRSKLRSCLTTYSFVDISLVRGREYWRVVGVKDSVFTKEFLLDSEKSKVVARVFGLSSRLLAGEDENQFLFEDLKSFVLAVSALSEEKVGQIENYEVVMILRLLFHLGYLEDKPAFKPFIKNGDWDEVLVSAIIPLKKTAIASINNSFKASQL